MKLNETLKTEQESHDWEDVAKDEDSGDHIFWCQKCGALGTGHYNFHGKEITSIEKPNHEPE